MTDDPAVDWDPVWSPDGRYLYFGSDRGGSMNLWRVAIDEVSGNVLGQPQAVTTPSPFAAHMSFSADGSRMVFASVLSLSNVGRAPFDATTGRVQGAPQPVTSGSRNWYAPVLSPDGRHIAGVESPGPAGRRPGVLLYHVDSRTYERLTDFGSGPRWLGDSRRLVFDSDEGKLFLVDSRTRTSYEIWSVPGEQLFSPVVSQDCRWPYFTRANTESDIWLATFPGAQASSDRR